MPSLNRLHVQTFAPLRQSKILILDRDGTLNMDNGYEFELKNLIILPEAIDFLAKASALGFGMVIATNQGGVALGKFSIPQSLEFNAEIVSRLKSEGIILSSAYICFHHPSSPRPDQRNCMCRKPRSGMINQILLDYRIDKNNTMMIGDQEADAHAAISAGIKFQKIGDCNLWDKAAMKLEEI